MHFQKIKRNLFDKIILGKAGFAVSLKFADIGIQPDRLGQIKTETGFGHRMKNFGCPVSFPGHPQK